MKKIITIPAYLWAIACFLVVPVTFISNDSLASQLAKLPFMKIHPRYSGGEINRSYLSGGLQVTVNKPVFWSHIAGGPSGFVQVSFSAIDSLPATIREHIDFNFDDNPDFTISIDTKTGTTRLNNQGPKIRSLDVSARVKDSWIIRVNMDE
jgi:hypothetical protein